MKRAHWLGIFALGSVGAIAMACGGSDASTGPAATNDAGASNLFDGATTTPPNGDSGTSPGADGGDDDDGDASTITDGGGNLDPDAGDDDDAGDAGACNTLTNSAQSILSTCSSQIPGLTGGVLVAGTYHLTQVQALGPAAFCQNQFQPTRIAQTLVLTVGPTGTGSAELVTVLANKAAKTSNLMLVPPADDSSPLDETQTCPPKTGAKTIYESALRAQKQILIIEGNYGTGRALYRYAEQ